MGAYINYWKVEGKVAKDHIGESPYIFSFIGGSWSMYEIRNKAKELYEKNVCDGILYRVIRQNPWGETTKCYFIYYDGKTFHRQDYIDNMGLMFEPFIEDGKELIPALPVGY